MNKVIRKPDQKLTEPKKLFNKNYLLLWQGQFVSSFGNVVYMFAMTAWITYELDSKAMVGLLGMVSGIPAVIFGIIAGTVADNYSRKKIIVISDFINGTVMSCLAFMFFILPDGSAENNQILLMGIFGVGIFGAITNAFFGPAIDASIPDIVPKRMLTQANSLGQLSRRSAQFAGQGMGIFFYLILIFLLTINFI